LEYSEGLIMRNSRQQKAVLYEATLADYATIENMWRYYVYDMGRYCGFIKGWECPIDLSFVPDDLTHYFLDQAKQVYLVKVGGQLAGFVFLKKCVVSSSVEWRVCEFFIAGKYQSIGIGQQVAKEVFSLYPGKWSLTVMPENLGALKFWRKTIKEVLGVEYTEVHKTVEELATPENPDPYPMIAFNFSLL